MRQKAVITGGTGFLGRAVVSALIARGWQIRMLVRQPVSDLPLANDDVELVFGSLSDTDSLRRLVDGAEAVVHVAGAIKARNQAEFMTINRDGTARLADAAARQAPAARLVHVSSLAAREPHLSDYAASKAAGEDALRSTAGHVSWIIVRPPAIYGPGDKATLPLFRCTKTLIAPLLQGPEARVCLIHVTDAAQAIASLCAEGPRQEVFELSDSQTGGYSWKTILSQAALAVSGHPRFIPIPPLLTRLAGGAAGLVGRLTGRATILSPGKAREILHPDWSSSPDRQPPATLWSPRFSLQKGFEDTVRWYRDARWL